MSSRAYSLRTFVHRVLALRLAVATLVAAYVSNESGHRPVPIDDCLPRDRVFPWA